MDAHLLAPEARYPTRTQVYLRTLANLTNPSEVRSVLQLARKQVRLRRSAPNC